MFLLDGSILMHLLVTCILHSSSSIVIMEDNIKLLCKYHLYSYFIQISIPQKMSHRKESFTSFELHVALTQQYVVDVPF